MLLNQVDDKQNKFHEHSHRLIFEFHGWDGTGTNITGVDRI